jgi:hypothetical protein
MAKRKTPKRSAPRAPSAAIRTTFKAWGLDQGIPEHWDELFEKLNDARQKRRGAPQIWTDKLREHFNELVFVMRLSLRMTEPELRKFTQKTDLAQLESIFGARELILRTNPEVIQKLADLPEIVYAAFPELNLGRKSPHIAEAHVIAWVLQQSQGFRRLRLFSRMDHSTLVKYILQGPPGSKSRE